MEQLKSMTIDMPESMTEIVARKIKTLIIRDEIHFGDHLSELSLAELFRVSKTPVREALIRLSLQDRLVCIKPRSGYYVFSPTNQEIDNLGSARICLEQGAIRTAMKKSPSGFLAALGRNMQEAARLQSEKSINSSYRELDFGFHDIFFQYAKNACLDEAYRMISSRVFAMRNRLNFSPEFIGNSISGHAAIFNHLMANDVDAACSTLEKHIEASFTDRARKALSEP